MQQTTVLWFKRDLRVHDNPALVRAVSLGLPVMPLFVVEPDYWALPDTSARQWAFVRESLIELRRDLACLGAPLVLRRGEITQQLEGIHKTHPVAHLLSHEETGNAWTFTRDKAVGAWAREQGIEWTELPQTGVIRRLSHRDRWTAHRQTFTNQPPLDAPQAVQGTDIDIGDIPNLTLASDTCPERQTGGRSYAQALLHSFLHTRGEPYRYAMSSPLAGEHACSRLSPHLAFGTISGREVHYVKAARAQALPTTGSNWAKSLRSFEARIAWRDHFVQKLEDEPAIEYRCMHPGFEGMRPTMPDASRLYAWEQGETGLPFVDACMRYTRATGWLNFRMRSMVTAIAAYHLWLDWRSFGPTLARYFTDYEPGIHWSQLQMQSGVTGMNTIRIYNPIKQGHDQDPIGAFTRRWCPELRDVPLAHLQTPWTWSDGRATLLDHTYPAPIVDVASAARAAKTAVFERRKDPAMRAHTARVVHKHASRKRPTKRRGTAKRSKTPSQQLSLDL